MRNEPITATEFFRTLERALAERLPVGWTIQREDPEAASDSRADTAFAICSPDGRRGRVAVEYRPNVEPRMVAELERRGAAGAGEARVVGAPFLSPRTRELLARAGLGYADAAGNLRLAAAEPALFVETVGESRNPWPEPRPLMSLKGRAVARVVRALCDFRPPYTTGELARRSGASPATASRVVALLEAEALVGREGRGNVTDVVWDELIRRWTQDYAVLESNVARSFIEPRGIATLSDKLAATETEYAATGSLAAQTPGAVAPPRLAMLYARDPIALAELLELRPAEAGANVLLLEPFDPVVFARASERDALRCAAYSQVAADLLTSPGRGPAEGEELMRWMKENEDAWRA